MTKDYELAEKLVGEYEPVKCVSVYRSPVDPELFIAHAMYGKYGQTACAVGHEEKEARLKAIVEGCERSLTSSPWDATSSVIVSSARKLDQSFLDPNYYIPLSPEKAKSAGLKPYNPNRKLHWIKGESYDVASPAPYVPVDMIYYDFRSNDQLYYANSSGVAAHFDRTRALENAVSELVERDALMRFWISGDARDISDYAASVSVYIRKRMDFWTHNQREMKFYLLPSYYGDIILATIVGTGWPAFVCGAAARLSCEEIRTRGDSETKLFERAALEAEGNYVAYANSCQVKIASHDVRTPFEHGLYYCSSENYLEIQKKIFDDKAKFDNLSPHAQFANFSELCLYLGLTVVDIGKISKVERKPHLYVVRAFSPLMIPISFSIDMFHLLHPMLQKYLYSLDIQPADMEKEDILGHVKRLPHFFP